MKDYMLTVEWEYEKLKKRKQVKVSAETPTKAIEEGEKYAATNYEEGCLDFSVEVCQFKELLKRGNCE